MILSFLYLYFAGTGGITFNPYHLAAATVCDMALIGTIGAEINDKDGFKLIDIEIK